MDARLDDYDWQEVFALAGEQDTPHVKNSYGYNNTASINRCPPLADVDNTPFAREDVAEIAWYALGENDASDWLVGGKLKDGRWFFIAAGCDYTGWDCQSGGNAYVALTREDIERFGMGNHERTRLAVSLPDGVEHRTDWSAG